MEIENQWCENIFVVLGNIIHEKVDDPFIIENRGKLHVSRSLPISSNNFKIQGVCDVVEFIKDENGVFIKQLNGKYLINVVEYKRGKPKIANVINYADSIQVASQMICINEMFNTECSGCVYYASIGRKVKMTNFNDLVPIISILVDEIHKLFSSREVPKIKECEQCRGCSFKDICFPKVKNKKTCQLLIQSAWSKYNEKTS